MVRNLTFTGGTGNTALGLVLAQSGNFDVAGKGVANVSSIVSGAFSLSKTGTGTLIFTGVNTFGGTLAPFINLAGTTQFSGANGSNTTATAYIIGGGTFVLDNTTAAGGNNNNRIADASTVTLGGGTFLYKGADAASTNSTETVGALSGGGGTITINAGGSNTAILTAASFTHAVGNGTELVNGTGLGSSTTAANQIILTAAPTLVGTTAPTAAINPSAQKHANCGFHGRGGDVYNGGPRDCDGCG